MFSRLLIVCSRLSLSAVVKNELEDFLYNRDIPWGSVIKTAEEEGVLPLLYHHLKPYNSLIPRQIMTELKKNTFQVASFNLWMINIITPLLIEFEKKDIRVVIIKGLRLVHTVYPEVHFRPFVDVDILVDFKQLKEIDQILREKGFQQKERVGFSANLKKKGEEQYWAFRPLYKKEALLIELHFNFPGIPRDFSLEKNLWQETKKIKINNVSMPILSPEYEFCLLCLHAQQHSYSRLIWLTDIAEFIEKEKINWDEVELIGSKEKITPSLYHALAMVNHFWPETVKNEILKRFPLNSWEKFWLNFFWPSSSILNRKMKLQPPMHTPTFIRLIAGRGLSKIMAILNDFFFPPAAWVAYYYGLKPFSLRFFLHYLWRLSRPFVIIINRIFTRQ